MRARACVNAIVICVHNDSEDKLWRAAVSVMPSVDPVIEEFLLRNKKKIKSFKGTCPVGSKIVIDSNVLEHKSYFRTWFMSREDDKNLFRQSAALFQEHWLKMRL